MSVVFNDGGNVGGAGLASNILIGTLTLATLNDPEGFTATLTPTFVEGAAAVAIATAASVTQVDTANFNGGSLTVSLGSWVAGDALSIATGGGISVEGAEVRFGGAAIGAVSGGTGSPLVVTLNTADATHAAVQALLGAIRYDNTTQNPTNFGNAPTRSVTMALNDSDPDDRGAGVIYTVTTTTANGTLFRDANANGFVDGGESLGLNATFTQADIDNGLIKYLHGGGGGAFDSLGFSVADGGEDGAGSLTGPAHQNHLRLIAMEVHF